MSTSCRFVLRLVFLCLLSVVFLHLCPAQAQTSSSGSKLAVSSSHQCLTVSNSATTASAPIVQFPCTGQTDGLWSFVPVGSYYHIVAKNSGMCLNLPNGTTPKGTSLVQQPCQTADLLNDQWSVTSVGSAYHFVSRSSGLCANVGGGTQAYNAAIIAWTCQVATVLNDQFTVTPIASATKVLPSTWSPIIPLAVNAIAIANLPNGKLLLWSADQQFAFDGDIGEQSGQTYTGIFDPATNSSSETLITSTGSDMFCPGTALLPDGRVLVNGGSSSPKTTLYDPASASWISDRDMNVPRGYEADTPLSNGSVFTLGGSWSGPVGVGKTGEVWTNGSGWKELSNVPEDNVVGPDPQGIYRGDNHLWLFAQSNGTVFHAGPSAQMNWITTSGLGSIQSAGSRGNDPYSINGNAVLYDVGKILKVGGAQAYQQNGSSITYAEGAAYVIDISQGMNAPVTVTQVGSMNYLRAFSSSVVLPNGSVVVIGGQSIPKPFTDTYAALAAEIWDPVTQTFSLLNPMQTPRTYHSTAILLPDGRVFVGGGGQCGVGCAANHLNAEILTPPYLLTADGSAAATRPVIVSAPGMASLGTSIRVRATGPVASFVLMRLSSITHATNNDQRRIPLTATQLRPSVYRLAIPADPGIVLPGYYMLFALNSQGTPSIAATVQIQ